jgi:hypothetical protein
MLTEAINNTNTQSEGMKRSHVDALGIVAIVLFFLFIVPMIPETLPFCKGGPPPHGYYSITFFLLGAGVVFYQGTTHLMWSRFPSCQ